MFIYFSFQFLCVISIAFGLEGFFQTNEIDKEIKYCNAYKNGSHTPPTCVQKVFQGNSPKDLKYVCHCTLSNAYDIGPWTVMMTLESPTNIENLVVQDVIAYHIQEVSLIPGNGFYSKVGKSIRVYMGNPFQDKTAKCFVYHNGILAFDLTNGTIPDDEGIERYGQCGILMIVQKNRKGEWILEQQLGFVKKIAKFTVVINGKNDLQTQMILPETLIGTETDIIAALNTGVNVAIENPPGTIVDCAATKYSISPENHAYSGLLFKSCFFGLSKIKESNFGKWTSVTTYINNNILHQRAMKLINIYHIFESVTEEEYGTVVVHQAATVTLGFKKKFSNNSRRHCRLIHEPSEREYDLSMLTYQESITMVDDDCTVEIFVEKKQHGQWRLEDRSMLFLRRAHLNIIAPTPEESPMFYSVN